MTKKILFLHGFFASGACIPACTLKQCFEGKAEVLTPDLPLYPQEALAGYTGRQQQRFFSGTDSSFIFRNACPSRKPIFRNDPVPF